MPGMWDICAGGAVDVGEDPTAAASRELLEELGIDAACTPVWDGPWEDGAARRWIHTHIAHSSQPPSLSGEVIEVAFLSRGDVLTYRNTGLLCPDSFQTTWPHINTLLA